MAKINAFGKRNTQMVIRLTIIAITILLITAGCYPGITGTVVDADTGKPIEDAVVLVEWTKTHGFGEHWTDSYKVVEVVTDKEGKFSISGVYNPLVNPPDLTIYKNGYVAWNNKYIFPKREHRADFRWQSSYLYKLQKFKNTYSYIDHELFITGVTSSTIAPEKKQVFYRTYSEAEEKKVIEEQDERNKK